MKTVNFSEARSNLKAVLDRVVEDADVTIITRRDADDVVVMSLSTWNAWKETEYLLASPANAKQLREAIARADAGRTIQRDLIESPKRAFGVHEPDAPYSVAKPKKKPAAKRNSKK